MTASILHDKAEGTCYLCRLLYDDYSRKATTEHHVLFGSGRRHLSEVYGLKVYLCFAHHGGKGADDVHRPDLNDYDRRLKQIAQRTFERRLGSRADWMGIFGKNYLD